MSASPDLGKYKERLACEGSTRKRDYLFGPEAPTEPRARPVIIYDETRHDIAVREAADILVKAGRPLFLRRLSLTWLRDVPAKDFAEQPIMVKRFTDEGMRENLRDELSELTNWRRKRSDANIAVPPLVCTMLVDLAWKLGVVPEVDGLFLAPTLRPDGSLLAAEGYDPTTRLLLVDLPSMPPIAVEPSRKEAEEALALLGDLLAEVMFVSRADRSVALSLILSAVVRGALAHIPLHIIKAPTIGSGKSFLVDVANVIATGQRCAAVAARSETEKWERQIAMALHGGDPIVSLDNFNGELRSDLLAQAITQSVVKALLPYGREMVEIECRSVLTANGNNISIADDLGRRVVLCQIDAKAEKPWERRFASNPLEAIGKDRGRYVAAALVLARAYLAAGEPMRGVLPPLNGFADYTRFVREPLVWLGEVDPVQTQDTARSDDNNLQRKIAAFSAMAECFGVGEANARTIIEMLAEPTDEALRPKWNTLQDALAGAVAPKPLNAASLGYYLRAASGNVITGLRLGNRNNRMGTKAWWMEAPGGGYGS